MRLAQTHRILSRLERQQHHSASASGVGAGGTRAMKRLKDAPKLFMLNHAGGSNPVIYNVAEWLTTCREPSNTDAALEIPKLTKRYNILHHPTLTDCYSNTNNNSRV